MARYEEIVKIENKIDKEKKEEKTNSKKKTK